ncbi:hypothetical protein LXA43DRAFT_1069106 [Ganoderma leucocontextum]|nr:hypothetical protein LXA43DRAFT_1069106 [Ganoderma leucocontextum]
MSQSTEQDFPPTQDPGTPLPQAEEGLGTPGYIAAPPQAQPPPETAPALSITRTRTRAEKSLTSLEKGKGRAGVAPSVPSTAKPAISSASSQVGPLPALGVVDSLQSLSISDSSLKANLPAIRADIQLLGTTAHHLLRMQAADRAELRAALASVVATTDSINERLTQTGIVPGKTTELLESLEARVDSLAGAVEQNETALTTEFTSFQDHHDVLLEDCNRLSLSLSGVQDSLAELSREVHSLSAQPATPAPGSAQRPLMIDAPPQAEPLVSSLPRNGARFRPLPTPTIIRPSTAQAPAAPPMPLGTPVPQLHPRALRRRQPDTGPRAMASRFKRPRVDIVPQTAPALQFTTTATGSSPTPHLAAPVAGPSMAPQAPPAAPVVALMPSGSMQCRVRFGSIGWAANPMTLRQQVYAAALPVWDVDFALFACLDTVALDDSDMSYIFLTFLSRADAQAFVDAWYANRIKSASYGRAQAHIV